VNNVIYLINCVIGQDTVSFIFELLVINNYLINMKMKKIILFACIMILSLSAGTVFASTPDSKAISDNSALPAKKEVKLSGEELNRLTKRDGEVRNMETNVSASQEGHRRRDRVIVEGGHRRSGGVVYIGGGTVLLIILIILLV
jgi:hypothetical protein